MTEWIDCDERLQTIIDTLPSLIGIDTEFMRTDTYAPKLALVQLTAHEHIALIDTTAKFDIGPFAARLADPATMCIMHSASEDLEALAKIIPQGLGQLFDTQLAAAFAGLGFGLSYQKLVFELTRVELLKAETRSDWLKRPLTPEQLLYAAQDVLYLPTLHASLSKNLSQRGYSEWLAEDCARFIERARQRVPDSQPQLNFRNTASWPHETQALLRRVLMWRETTARTIDRPRPWLLDDARLLDLVAKPPSDNNDLFERTRGLRALRELQRTELFTVLKTPLIPAELEFAPILAGPGPREKSTLTALKAIVAARAMELDLPEGLLCSRKHLDTLVMSGTWPAALEGWRAAVLQESLMARLPHA